MKVSIETISPVTRKIQVNIPRDRVARELDRAYQNLQRGVNMRGFRPGHVPRSVLEARFRSQIEGEVTTKLISDTLESTIEQNKLFVVSQPVIEPGRLTPKEDFEYTATIEIKPEVQAKDYAGLELTREKYADDEGAIERQLNTMREQKANLEVVEEERPLQEGDIARIDYTMKVDGRSMDKGQPRNVHVSVTPGSFLPGFSDQLIGMKPGETRTFDLTVPADFQQPTLAGKTLTLTVTLNDIKRRVVPELDDEFARDLEFDDLEALREHVRKDLREHLDASSDIKVRRDAAQKLIEANPIELPQGLVNQQIELLAQEQRRQMGRQAPKGRIELTDALRAQFSEEAGFRLKASLILESIAKQEGLEVSEEDVDTRLAEIAEETGQRVEAVRGLYMKNNAIEDLKSKILEEKALEFVMEKANVTDMEKPFAEHAHDHEH
jgi:trigger factor